MTTPEERFLELYAEKCDREDVRPEDEARDAFRDWSTEYATIPRADMPVLDENGVATGQWFNGANAVAIPQRHRRYAALYLAMAEWHEAKEQREADAAKEAETQLSERRNAILTEMWEQQGRNGSPLSYDAYSPRSIYRIAVDMRIEAEDAK